METSGCIDGTPVEGEPPPVSLMAGQELAASPSDAPLSCSVTYRVGSKRTSNKKGKPNISQSEEVQKKV